MMNWRIKLKLVDTGRAPLSIQWIVVNKEWGEEGLKQWRWRIESFIKWQLSKKYACTLTILIWTTNVRNICTLVGLRKIEDEGWMEGWAIYYRNQGQNLIINTSIDNQGHTSWSTQQIEERSTVGITLGRVFVWRTILAMIIFFVLHFCLRIIHSTVPGS